jgi:1-acyl-sn-glycerol-3-phosphate acyltransferase
MSKSYSPAWRLFTVILFRPLIHVLVRNKWAGRENIPKKGPVIIAPNHMSYADWGTDALFFYESGRYPTFMIKASAFKVPFIGKMLYGCGQIPVNRGAADAALALKQAEQALAAGAAVIIYPEGTATRDPDLWPMVAKTGVARLALATGVPVIPVARWGTQNVLPYGSKKAKLWPRQTVRTVAGKPVDLSEWAGKQTSAKALRAATDAIMNDVTALLASLRDQEPPAIPFDPAKSNSSIPSRTVEGSTATADDSSVPGEAPAGGDTGTAMPGAAQ